MTKLDEIKNAVFKLSGKDRRDLLDWLNDLDWQEWDKQIERDAAAGKLDKLEDRARQNFKAGKFREI